MRKQVRLFTFLQSTLLACLLGSCVAGCLYSAFSLESVHVLQLVLWCGIFAAAASVSFLYRLGLLPGCGTLLAAVIYWHTSDLAVSAEALIFRISDSLGRTYGFPSLFWSNADLSRADLTSALCVLAGITVLTVTWTLCRRKHVLFAIAAALIPVLPCFMVTNRVSDPAWLLALLLGLIVILISQPIRRINPAQGNVLSAMALIPAALMLVSLFLLLPKEGYTRSDSARSPFLDTFETGRLQLSQTGLNSKSDKVNLSNAGPLKESDEPVMKVTFSEGGLLYLRGRSYDIYTGTGWQTYIQGDSLPWLTSHEQMESPPKVTVKTVKTEPVRFVPYYIDPDTMRSVGNVWKNAEGLTEYGYRLYSQPELLDLFTGELNPSGGSNSDYYLQLPESTAAWAQPFVEELLADVPANRVPEFIKSYLQSIAGYSLHTGYMPQSYKDLAQWFIAESPTGYCVHFATAATVLLRAYGINARYVTGYLVQTAAGRETLVMEKNAHAWVEYYDPSCGWRILDPSGAAQQPEDTPSADVTKPALDVPQPTAPTAPRPATPSETVPVSSAPTQPDPAKASPMPLIIVLCTGGILLIAQWKLRLALRRKQRNTGSVNARILASWAEVTRLNRLLGQCPDTALLTLAQEARFSDHKLGEDDLPLFDSAIAEAIGQLRKKPLLKQLLYRLIYAAY